MKTIGENLISRADESATLASMVVDAARMIGCSRSMFFKLLRSGRCPLKAVCFGRLRLYAVEQIKQWTAAGCPVNWGLNG